MAGDEQCAGGLEEEWRATLSTVLSRQPLKLICPFDYRRLSRAGAIDPCDWLEYKPENAIREMKVIYLAAVVAKVKHLAAVVAKVKHLAAWLAKVKHLAARLAKVKHLAARLAKVKHLAARLTLGLKSIIVMGLAAT